MGRRSALTLGLLAFTPLACGAEREQLPPFAQASLVVDTNLPVPHVVSRLRVDLYAEDGSWIESRDIARPDPRDWPVSFSVYSRQESSSSRAWVRLRAYPEARVRDYRGERFWDWTDPLSADPAPSEGPRLTRDGADRTPSSEPSPLVTVDRLLLVRLEPERTGQISLVLSGECAGTMARLAASAGAGPVLNEAESCIDSEKQRVTVSEQAPAAASPIAETVQGSWGAEPCAPDADPERVCIAGGATMLGTRELTLLPDSTLDVIPERILRHRAFHVDRNEVSVGRFRASTEAGFVPSSWPTVNDGPLSGVEGSCSFTSTPGEREDFALTCISWRAARELCQFDGGDLPSEAEWEHVATTAGSGGRRRFPWGDQEPSCERAVYGRLALAGSPGVCQAAGSGPLPITAAPEDVTPRGVIGLAGGVSEWTLDRAALYTDDCWRDAPHARLGCFSEQASMRTLRGGGWPAPPTVLRSAARFSAGASGKASFIGFRCVYPAAEAGP
jgi:formylglycine-generating enzyme required for sulfatase activity